MSFETRKIVGNDLKIGDYGSTIQLIILDFKSKDSPIVQVTTYSSSYCNLPLDPRLLSTEPELTVGRDILAQRLTEYLELLHNAGHHVLFSLPQFDPRGAPMNIDYSLMETTHIGVSDIHGITVQQINTYMSSLWLKSAMLAHGGGLQMPGLDVDWRAFSLAEFSTLSYGYGTYGQFRMTMGPPTVEILCTKEVVVYFSIDEIEFFNDYE